MKKLLLILAFTQSLFAYSYTAFPGITTGEKTLTLTQFVYGDGTGFVGSDVYLGYGITDKFDITTCISVNNVGPVTWSAMPRYVLTPGILGAIKFNDASVSPQIHANWDFGSVVTLQANLAVQLTYNTMTKPAFYGVASPVFKIGATGLDVYCDVIPVYCLQDDMVLGFVRPQGFSLDLVPGIGYGIGSNLFSFAAPLANVSGEFTPSFGVWWLFMISGK